MFGMFFIPPKKVDSYPKTIDYFPEKVSSFCNTHYGSARKILLPLHHTLYAYTRKIALKSDFFLPNPK